MTTRPLAVAMQPAFPLVGGRLSSGLSSRPRAGVTDSVTLSEDPGEKKNPSARYWGTALGMTGGALALGYAGAHLGAQVGLEQGLFAFGDHPIGILAGLLITAPIMLARGLVAGYAAGVLVGGGLGAAVGYGVGRALEG